MDPLSLLVLVGLAAGGYWIATSDDAAPPKKTEPKPDASPAPSTSSTARPSLPAGPTKPTAAAPVGQHVQAQWKDGKWYGGKVQKADLSDPDAIAWDAGTPPYVANPSTHTAPASATRSGAAAPAPAPPTSSTARPSLPAGPVGPVGPVGPANMGATISGVTEPEVMRIDETSAQSYSPATAIGHTTGQTLSAAAAGTEVVPVFGTVAGAIYGFAKGLGESIAAATSENDDDRFRCLYEVGAWPVVDARTGRPLAMVRQDISKASFAIVQHARILEQAHKNGFGLETIRGWLADSSHKADGSTPAVTASSPSDPSQHEGAQRAYFQRLAGALVARAQTQAAHGQKLDPIPSPSGRAFVLPTMGTHPAAIALDTWIRVNPTTVREIKRNLDAHPGAWSTFAKWLTDLRRAAGLHTPDPLRLALAVPAKKRPIPWPKVKASAPAKPAPSLPAGPTAPASGQHVQAQWRDGKWYGGTVKKMVTRTGEYAIAWDVGTAPYADAPVTHVGYARNLKG